MKIKGKVAIVVGGAQGIGQACVERLANAGAKVCIADVDCSKGDEVAKVINDHQGKPCVIYSECDITSEEDVKKLFRTCFEQFGQQAEIVLNTAGIVDEKNWKKCIDVNLCGSINLVNAALMHLGKDKGGKGGTVILTSSISGIQPEFWGPVYSATKHAVTALARSWALEENYRSHGIRFNVLCPAATDTGFLKQIVNAYHVEYHTRRLQEIDKFTVEEVARGFIELVENDDINGQALRLSRDSGTTFIDFPNSVYN